VGIVIVREDAFVEARFEDSEETVVVFEVGDDFGGVAGEFVVE